MEGRVTHCKLREERVNIFSFKEWRRKEKVEEYSLCSDIPASRQGVTPWTVSCSEEEFWWYQGTTTTDWLPKVGPCSLSKPRMHIDRSVHSVNNPCFRDCYVWYLLAICDNILCWQQEQRQEMGKVLGGKTHCLKLWLPEVLGSNALLVLQDCTGADLVFFYVHELVLLLHNYPFYSSYTFLIEFHGNLLNDCLWGYLVLMSRWNLLVFLRIKRLDSIDEIFSSLTGSLIRKGDGIILNVVYK